MTVTVVLRWDPRLAAFLRELGEAQQRDYAELGRVPSSLAAHNAVADRAHRRGKLMDLLITGQVLRAALRAP